MTSRRRDWALYTALTFCFSYGFATYNGIFQNFFREALHGTPAQLGILETLREVPGLLTALLAGTLASLAETRLATAALLVCALGIGLTGQADGFWMLVLFNVLWSVGGHLWFSVQPAITLGLAEGREGGRHLGRMSSVSSVAVLVGLASTLAVFALLGRSVDLYRVMFIGAGALIAIAGVLALGIAHRPSAAGRQRIVLRRRYRLYYLLTFLEGCRRQIFTTFATFVLIAVYRQPVTVMLALAFANAVLMALAGPVVGRTIDRVGERPVMCLYYGVLVAVFAGYALVPWPVALWGLYMLDGLLFSFSMGLTTYLQRIVLPGEMTPSLAMGQTMNHVAAVVMPITGGWLWHRFHNYQIPFWIGVGVLLASYVAARRLPSTPHSAGDAAPAGTPSAEGV